MHRFLALLVLLAATACSGVPPASIDPIPGRISPQREARDRATCTRIDTLSDAHPANTFLASLSRECHEALAQILDAGTPLDVFDVARAYLDSLHAWANAADYLESQGQAKRLSSSYGAWLLGRQVGLLPAMRDWREALGRDDAAEPLPPEETYV